MRSFDRLDIVDAEAPPSYAEATGQTAVSSTAWEDRQLDHALTEKQERFTEVESSNSVTAAGPLHRPDGFFVFRVSLRKPMLELWSLTIAPEQQSPHLPSWELKYTSKHNATMHRHISSNSKGAHSKQVAQVKFPERKWPGCGPIITFWPHEAEIARKGLRHVSATDRLMAGTGWYSTGFALDMPALNGARVVWKVASGKNTAIHECKTHSCAGNMKSEGLATLAQNRMPEASQDSWSPFQSQHLVEELSNHALATYARAAPWAKHTGMLSIPLDASEELIECIAITCAAMVGTQDRIGLTSSLMESGLENVIHVKGKGRDKARRDVE